MNPRDEIYEAIEDERQRQIRLWGEQDIPMVSHRWDFEIAKVRREERQSACDFAVKRRSLTWYHILMEEVTEVFAEADSDKQMEELVHVAAVAVQAIEYLAKQRRARGESNLPRRPRQHRPEVDAADLYPEALKELRKNLTRSERVLQGEPR